MGNSSNFFIILGHFFFYINRKFCDRKNVCARILSLTMKEGLSSMPGRNSGFLNSCADQNMIITHFHVYDERNHREETCK